MLAWIVTQRVGGFECFDFFYPTLFTGRNLFFPRFGPPHDTFVSVSEEDKEVQEAADAAQKLILETSSNGNLSDSAAETTKPVSTEDSAN